MIKMIKELRSEIKALKENGHIQTEFGGYAGDDDPLTSVQHTLRAIYFTVFILIYVNLFFILWKY